MTPGRAKILPLSRPATIVEGMAARAVAKVVTTESGPLTKPATALSR